jgi:hypothetical protein
MQLHRVDGEAVVKALALDVNMPVVAMIAVDGEEAAAAWGLAWGKGRCFLWFHIRRIDPNHRFVIIRECRKMLKRARQLGEREVFTIRDPNYETSERLLKLCGFRFHAMEDGHEVWITRW